MSRQCLRHVDVTESEPCLLQVFGVGAQQCNFAPVHSGRQHQPVEVVVFRLAAPDAQKGFLEYLAYAAEIHVGCAGKTQADIVQPNRLPVLALDLVRPLVQYPHAHVLQHGQGNG